MALNESGIDLSLEGSVSSDTLDSHDLLRCFMDYLDDIRSLIERGEGEIMQGQSPIARQITVGKIDDYLGYLERIDLDTVDESELVDELIEALGEFASSGYYFGSHPNDGADFGYWAEDSSEY
jgi:hypothetical protein